MAPPLPVSFVPRPRETDALISLLQTRDENDPAAITRAPRGAGGFGKTTLAAAICHDESITRNGGLLGKWPGHTISLRRVR